MESSGKKEPCWADEYIEKVVQLFTEIVPPESYVQSVSIGMYASVEIPKFEIPAAEECMRNVMKSVDLYKACMTGCGDSCETVGQRFLEVGNHVRDQDQKSAIEFYEKACDVGERSACYQAGALRMAQKHLKNQRFQLAERDLAMGCALDHYKSCQKLASLYKTTGYQANQLTLVSAFFSISKVACFRGDDNACEFAQQFINSARDV